MRKPGNGERGGALVEFAVVAPFMFIVFFGAIEFGWMMWLWHSVDYGARVGSRWAVVRGQSCSNAGVCPTTTGAVSTFVKGAVPGLNNATVNAVWSDPSPGTYTQAPTGCAASEAPGCIVTVTVQNKQTFTVPFLFNKQFTLKSTSQGFVQ